MTEPFDAAGTLLDAYRRVDWAGTPLGPPQGWSPALRGALDLLLNTRTPGTLFWGPELVLLYNEAYVPMIADKHPAALGARTTEVFPEIWDTIGPMLSTVMSGGRAVWMEDLRLLMNRHGFLEETYFTFSYSAVRGAGGEIEGAIDIASETTAQVLGHRRLELLGRLHDGLAGAETVPQVRAAALPVLRSSPDLTSVTVRRTGTPATELVVVDAAGGRVARIPVGSDASVLEVGLNPHLPADAGYLRFLRLLGASLTQGVHRARALQAERAAATGQRRLAEALQRSLLTSPAQPGHLEVAVRYHPAADGARIGGDWYDAFTLPDGRLTVVVGDVTGHDREAAAAMSQLRNLLRGIAFTTPRPPAGVLAELDAAMTGLGVDVFATAVVVDVEVRGCGVRWSNAGHPPPLLLRPDGTVELLERRGETLLGTRAAVRRTDHEVELPAGASLVLYTDGLVERRGSTLDDGLAALLRTVEGRSDLNAEELCDLLLATFAAGAEDDVVLTVLRA